MVRKTDLTEQKFGLLTVIGAAESDKGRARWHCRCTCGASIVAYAANLKSDKTRSCGTCDLRATPGMTKEIPPCRYVIRTYEHSQPITPNNYGGYAMVLDRTLDMKIIGLTLYTPRNHDSIKNPHAARMLYVMARDMVNMFDPKIPELNEYGMSAAAIQKWCRQHDIEIEPTRGLGDNWSANMDVWMDIPSVYRSPPQGSHYR